MMIKDLTPGLAERGKIKIGNKGRKITSRSGTEFQPPQKLDHFLVTTLERGPDGNFKRDDDVHRLIGEKPKVIPVRVLFNDPTMNMMSRYACMIGRKMWCAGDGETAQRLKNDGGTREQVSCPCHRIQQGYNGRDRCKINAALSVMIDGVPGVGAVWKFRTTSWNTTQALTSSLFHIAALSGGALAGLPLELTLSPKNVTTPDGGQMTAYIVSLQYPGTVIQLRGEGYKLLESDATHNFRLRHLEEQVARRLALPAPSSVPLDGDDIEDVCDEFYPDSDSARVEEPARKTAERPTRREFVETHVVRESKAKVREEPKPEPKPKPEPDPETESRDSAEEAKPATKEAPVNYPADDFPADAKKPEQQTLKSEGTFFSDELENAKNEPPKEPEAEQPDDGVFRVVDLYGEVVHECLSPEEAREFYKGLSGECKTDEERASLADLNQDLADVAADVAAPSDSGDAKIPTVPPQPSVVKDVPDWANAIGRILTAFRDDETRFRAYWAKAAPEVEAVLNRLQQKNIKNPTAFGAIDAVLDFAKGMIEDFDNPDETPLMP